MLVQVWLQWLVCLCWGLTTFELEHQLKDGEILEPIVYCCAGGSQQWPGCVRKGGVAGQGR